MGWIRLGHSGNLVETSRTIEPDTRWAVLEVFVRGDVERSQVARQWSERFCADRTGIKLTIRDVVANKQDLIRFWDIARHFRIEQPALPAFYVSGRFHCGWDEAAVSEFVGESLTIEVFVRHGCSRCAAARPFLHDVLAPRYPGYRLIERDVAWSGDAQARLQQLAQRYGVAATSVPALHVCGRLVVGYYSDESTGRQWDELLRRVTIPAPPRSSSTQPRRTIAESPVGRWQLALTLGPWSSVTAIMHAPDPREEVPPPPVPSSAATPPDPRNRDASPDGVLPGGDLPPAPLENVSSDAVPLPGGPEPANDLVDLPWLGPVRWRAWGLPTFTLVVGLIDGFNPCAMWVLLFLLSLLVNLHDRWKILAVAGTFVVISGAAYYAFMAAWLNIFQLIGMLRPRKSHSA